VFAKLRVAPDGMRPRGPLLEAHPADLALERAFAGATHATHLAQEVSRPACGEFARARHGPPVTRGKAAVGPLSARPARPTRRPSCGPSRSLRR
jgi:hypothetical protein